MEPTETLVLYHHRSKSDKKWTTTIHYLSIFLLQDGFLLKDGQKLFFICQMANSDIVHKV